MKFQKWFLMFFLVLGLSLNNANIFAQDDDDDDQQQPQMEEMDEEEWLLIGTVGGISIQLSEVKFLDLLKTNYCESICQGCFH